MFKKNVRPAWTIDCRTLDEPFTEFLLSRQSMLCTAATLEWYRYTAGMFVVWCQNQGLISPDQIKSNHVDRYIAELAMGGKTDQTCHDHARAIRTLLRYWVKRDTIPKMIEFEMPRKARRRLPMLTEEQIQIILDECNVRDTAIILTIADCGIRRREAINANWGHIDMMTGLLRIYKGKGNKDRSTIVGATARLALMKYKKTLDNIRPDAPMFQTQTGERFKYDGFIQIFHRLSAKAGTYVGPHALRRSFTILSLRAGMDALNVQNMGGWTSLDMVQHYAQMDDYDLIQASKSHSAMDYMKKKK